MQLCGHTPCLGAKGKLWLKPSQLKERFQALGNWENATWEGFGCFSLALGEAQRLFGSGGAEEGEHCLFSSKYCTSNTGKKRVVNTEIQGVACSSAPSSTHHLRHGSRVKHNALHLLTLHNSRVHLLWLYYQTTRMQLPKHITEGFHLYNEYIGVKNNPMYIFFLSIWTPCLVPLFIMLPAEY